MHINKKLIEKHIIQIFFTLNTKLRKNYKDNISLATYIVKKDI